MNLNSKFALVSVAELLQHLSTDRYMGKHEASKYSGLSERTLIDAPDLQKYQPNGKILFRKSEIDRWMERHAKGKNVENLDAALEELQQEFRKKKA